VGEAAGTHRRPASTPYEHLPSLERSLEPRDELAPVTEAYVRVRYAEIDPPAEEVAALAARVDQIHQAEASEVS
jgi:hypothetical protein